MNAREKWLSMISEHAEIEAERNEVANAITSIVSRNGAVSPTLLRRWRALTDELAHAVIQRDHAFYMYDKESMKR